jgi:hypothetical protein
VSDSRWRNHAAPIIEAILAQRLQPGEEKKALHDAYPFGERKMWPYKIWCNEIRRQKTGKDVPMESPRARPTKRETNLAYAKLCEWEGIYGKRAE